MAELGVCRTLWGQQPRDPHSSPGRGRGAALAPILWREKLKRGGYAPGPHSRARVGPAPSPERALLRAPGSTLGVSSRPLSGPGPGTAVPWDLGTPRRAPQVGRTLPTGTEAGCSVRPRASVCPVARDDGPDGDWAMCVHVATLPAPCRTCGALSEVRRLGRGRGALVRHVSSARRGDLREEELSTLNRKVRGAGRHGDGSGRPTEKTQNTSFASLSVSSLRFLVLV